MERTFILRWIKRCTWMPDGGISDVQKYTRSVLPFFPAWGMVLLSVFRDDTHKIEGGRIRGNKGNTYILKDNHDWHHPPPSAYTNTSLGSVSVLIDNWRARPSFVMWTGPRAAWRMTTLEKKTHPPKSIRFLSSFPSISLSHLIMGINKWSFWNHGAGNKE